MAETHASVTAVINQLAANQQVMQQQFAAVTTQRNTTYQPPPPPPITQFTIPNYTTFPTSRRGGGDRRGGRGCGGRANLAITGGRNTRTPFANFMGRGGQGRLPPIGGQGGGIASFAQQSPARNAATMTRTLSRDMRIGTYVFRVVLTLRMGIHQKRAWRNGDGQIITKDSIEQIQISTLQLGTMHAQRRCTKASCLVGIVGQSREILNV